MHVFERRNSTCCSGANLWQPFSITSKVCLAHASLLIRWTPCGCIEPCGCYPVQHPPALSWVHLT